MRILMNLRRRLRRRREGGRAGFSVVEAMVLAVVLVLIASSVMSSLPRLMASTQEAHRIQQANALMRHVLTEIGEVPFQNLEALNGLTIDAAALQGTTLEGLTGYEASLRVVLINPNLKKVEVQVVYTPIGSSANGAKIMSRNVIQRSNR